MTQERRVLMLCACEFWCGDPYISGKDALEDARQVAAMLKEKGIADKEVEQTLIRVACRMLSDNRHLPPHEAIRRALWLYDASGEDEGEEVNG